MKKVSHRGSEEARSELPALIDAAQDGHTTIITRRGRPVAALVPLENYRSGPGQQSLLPLEGSGRRLWGSSSTRTLRRLRDEWGR